MSPTPENQHEPARQQGISLNELTEAFAQAMGMPAKSRPTEEPQTAGSEEPAVAAQSRDEAAGPGEPLPEADQPAADQVHDQGHDDGDDDACPISPRTILEAMLFVGDREGRPLTPARAAELMRGVEPDDVPRLVGELNSRYAAQGCPYCIVTEGSGYRLTLHKSYGSLRSRFYGRIREARLSQTAVDVLAIIAYNQPITAEEVKNLRGKPCGHLLSQLVRRGLLRIERPEDKPRVANYRTTDRFLELFGLETLADLPQSETMGDY